MENPPLPPPRRLRPLPSLPDDILIEILTKLLVKSRARFRSVSKSWKLLVSAVYKELLPAMYGLFYINRITRKVGFVRVPSTYRTPAPIDLALTFLPPDLRPKAMLADCRNGLFLVHSPNLDLICICNPATKKWAQIPSPPSVTKKSQLVLAFDPRRSKIYHIVSIPCELQQAADDDGSEFGVFSSATREWATIKRFGGPINYGIARFGFSGGILYYVDPITDDTFAVDVEGRTCWRVMRPGKPSDTIVKHCFGQSKGILHYVTYTQQHLDRSVFVWVLENSSSNEYVLKHRNAYKTVVGGRFDGLINPAMMAFHTDLDVLFVILEDELLSYNLISGEVLKSGCQPMEGLLFPYTPYLSEDLEL